MFLIISVLLVCVSKYLYVYVIGLINCCRLSKITEDKSSKSRIQTPDATLIIATKTRGLKPASQQHFKDHDARVETHVSALLQ